jgi:hypothetical protein
MTELILGKNNDNYNKKPDRNFNSNKHNGINRKSIENKDDQGLEYINSENHNLFNNQNKLICNNELHEINENFKDINEISVSEKTDNISNISMKSNFLKLQKPDEDKEDNSNKLKDEIDEDEINKESKPRFAISHKLSN